MNTQIVIPKRLKTGVLFFGMKDKVLYTIGAIGLGLILFTYYLSGGVFDFKMYIIPALIVIISFIRPNGIVYPILLVKAFNSHYSKANKTKFESTQQIKYNKVIKYDNYQVGIRQPHYFYNKKTNVFNVNQYLTLDVYDAQGHRLLRNVEIDAKYSMLDKKGKKVEFYVGNVTLPLGDKEVTLPLNLKMLGIKDKKVNNVV